MWLNNEVLKEDLDFLVKQEYIDWERLREKTVLVTGVTGLIGFNLVSGLLYADSQLSLGLKVLAFVRDIQKAENMFEEQLKTSVALKFVIGDIEAECEIQNELSYIVHCAGPTDSAYFTEKPVETIKTTVDGTRRMLSLARKKHVEGFVYLSSMEVYGTLEKEQLLTEEDFGYSNPMIVRNCYSESKRMCEALCVSYAREYHLPISVIRLAQTFGPGVSKEDKRVFSEFARCVMEGKDIALLTDGKSRRCYLYTMDAVSAILTILLSGERGQVYNAANPTTYCSVCEMAEMVAREIAKGRIGVKYMKDEEKAKKFSPPHFYNLNVSRLESLQWAPKRGLKEMYERMIRAQVQQND